MAVTVRITETYDMKTSVGKLGLVGIHTPQLVQLRKLYPGLLKNYRYVRFVRCDVVGACASVLPADPLQIGVSSGAVAPEDMFNPILYTAVTNTSFDTLVSRIRNMSDVSVLGSVAEADLGVGFDSSGAFKAYYALLSDEGRFRKSMPQSGFVIKGLVPLAHTVISTFGNVGAIGNDSAMASDGENEISVPSLDVPESNVSLERVTGTETFYRGKSIRMPRIPIHTGMEQLTDIPYPNIPKTHVLAMVLPPAKLNEFFYRMRVIWTIRFEEVVSTLESMNTSVWLDAGENAHASNYTYVISKAEMEHEDDMVSVTDVELTKVMES